MNDEQKETLQSVIGFILLIIGITVSITRENTLEGCLKNEIIEYKQLYYECNLTYINPTKLLKTIK